MTSSASLRALALMSLLLGGCSEVVFLGTWEGSCDLALPSGKRTYVFTLEVDEVTPDRVGGEFTIDGGGPLIRGPLHGHRTLDRRVDYHLLPQYIGDGVVDYDGHYELHTRVSANTQGGSCGATNSEWTVDGPILLHRL